MDRGDIAFGLVALLLFSALGIGAWAMTDASNNRMDEYNDPNNSADYLVTACMHVRTATGLDMLASWWQ